MTTDLGMELLSNVVDEKYRSESRWRPLITVGAGRSLVGGDLLTRGDIDALSEPLRDGAADLVGGIFLHEVATLDAHALLIR